MARRVNEQTRGIFRLIGKPNGGVKILRRVRRRVEENEWLAYTRCGKEAIVWEALWHINCCLADLVGKLRA